MQMFDAAQVHALLDYPSLIAALRAAHSADAMPLTSSLLVGEPPSEENKFLSLVAWMAGEAVAVKLVGVFPGNLSLPAPEPSVQGLVALFSGKTGAPVLVADGAAMTFRKTAADSGLGAGFLARRDARTLLVVGAGGLAPHVIMAHTVARPSIERVLIWNRTPARAQAVADSMALPGVSISVAPDLDTAVAKADVISCVTMATEPLVRGALLRPGTHVDLIGAYLPEMREADDDVVRRARVFVDTRKNCAGSGEIATPIARGLLTLDAIEADLFDLCTGRHPGRTDDDAITMYKNVGGAHLDLFTARHLLARAGAGT
jgi:ornithine cyclodeaminase/alanine dehydrogenase-like protein (mu-crystallin family)